MGVSNVYNSNVNIVKAAMSKRAQTTAAQAKPEYLQMTGSIFNAPGVNSNTTTANTITDLNTRKSLNYLNGEDGTNSTQPNNSGSSSIEGIESIDNASDGKAAAADAEADADNVRSLTSETKEDATTVNKFSSDAVKLDKKLTKDNKKYEKQLQKQEKELKQNNLELEKLVKESEEAQLEIDNASSELESLLSSNSFSINGAQEGASGADSDKIKELQSIIGSKSQVVQQNGRAIYSLQRGSSRTIRQMGQTNKAYVRTQNANKKSIEENQSTTDKVIKVAGTIEQVSALVSQVGQAVNYAGQGLVALGSASWISGPVAAALISTGTVMQKVGTVTDMVGQYGQAAANITKTAAYAADGNLAGAFQSAAAAIQTGVAAGKSTANLKKDFASIDAAAEQATQKAAANQAAKDIVDKNSNNLGGMTEKQARKAVSSDLQNQMANGDITFADGISNKDKITNFEQYAQKTTKNAQGATTQLTGSDILNQSFDGAQKNFTNTLTEQGLKFDSTTGQIVDGTGKEVSKKTKKSVNNAFSGTFKNIGTKAAKSSENFWDKFQKWGTSLQNAAALYSAYGNTNNYNQTNNTVPDFYFDQRTLDIMAKNQRRRAAIGAM